MRSLLVMARCAFVVTMAWVVSPAAALAQPPKAPNFEKVFEKKDADKDGVLTLDEFKTGLKDKGLENADKMFKRLDANGDGKLSLDEFKNRPQPKRKN